MLKKHKHNQIVGPVVILGAIVVIVSFLLFFDTHPERVDVSSTDGAITVIGNVPSEVEVTVQRDDGATSKEWTAAVESIYTIGPDGITLPSDVAIRFPLRAREESKSFVIGFFDHERSVWVPVETARDEARDYFEAMTNHFSS